MFCNLILPLHLTILWKCVENYNYFLESTSIFSSSSLLLFSPGIFLIYFCWLPWMGLCILGSDGIKWGRHRYIISVFPALLSASISVHVHNDSWLCNNSTTISTIYWACIYASHCFIYFISICLARDRVLKIGKMILWVYNLCNVRKKWYSSF